MSTVALATADDQVGGGVLVLALVIGLLGFVLLTVALIAFSDRSRQAALALRELAAAAAGLVHRPGMDPANRAQLRRRRDDAVQDLRALLGEGPSALETAHVAALQENAAWEAARALERTRRTRQRARERAAGRVATTLRRADEQAAQQRAIRELVSASFPETEPEDPRLAAAMQAAAARWLEAKRADDEWADGDSPAHRTDVSIEAPRTDVSIEAPRTDVSIEAPRTDVSIDLRPVEAAEARRSASHRRP